MARGDAIRARGARLRHGRQARCILNARLRVTLPWETPQFALQASRKLRGYPAASAAGIAYVQARIKARTL
jgi:hypothetical protein